jgi:hypothetical protein
MHFPVALLGDDMVPVVHEVLLSLLRAMEPSDVAVYRVVDVSGAVFRVRLRMEEPLTLASRLASLLGGAPAYDFYLAPESLDLDVVESVMVALSSIGSRSGRPPF